LVLNYLIIEVTLFCLGCSIYQCTVTAVHAPPKTYHVILPEINLALRCTD
jgi:hypothetical protein